MKTLVTGATGFIGSAVVRQLAAQKKAVRCLVRKSSDLSNLGGLKVDYAYGDVTDVDSVRRALKGCDRVIHLAAIYAIWLKDPNLMYKVNVNGAWKATARGGTAPRRSGNSGCHRRPWNTASNAPSHGLLKKGASDHAYV